MFNGLDNIFPYGVVNFLTPRFPPKQREITEIIYGPLLAAFALIFTHTHVNIGCVGIEFVTFSVRYCARDNLNHYTEKRSEIYDWDAIFPVECDRLVSMVVAPRGVLLKTEGQVQTCSMLKEITYYSNATEVCISHFTRFKGLREIHLSINNCRF